GGSGDDYLFGGDVQYLDNAGNPIDISAFDINDASGFTISPVYGKTRANVKPLPAVNNSGHNTLIGGADNDHIFAADNGDTVYGDQQTNTCALPSGALDTQPSETGQNAVAALGLDGNDSIVGGKGPDSIQGGGGDDLITGGGGNALICGGAGSDTIRTGSGNGHHRG